MSPTATKSRSDIVLAISGASGAIYATRLLQVLLGTGRRVHLTISPAAVLVEPMRLTTVSRLSSGRPRQFCVIWQNIRCSILFHLLVPGG